MSKNYPLLQAQKERMLEPWRGSDRDWDGKLVQLVSALFRSNRDVFWSVFILIILLAMGATAVFSLQIICTYLWGVYSKRAFSKTRTSGILLLALCAFVVTVAASFVGYSRESISWHAHINILAFSYLIYVLTVIRVDTYQTRREAQQSAGAPTNSSNTQP